MDKLIGTGVALVTPLNMDLSIDYNALESLVNFNIENGINYLVIMGTTGESVTVSKAEKIKIIKTVSKVNKGRLPIVLGIGGSSTDAVINEIKETDLTDITALLSVSPYYNKPTQEGLYQHFKAISEASSLPIILYNVPGRTSKNMLPETVLRLARDFDNIIAVKEAGNNVQQYLELLKNKPSNFLVISGDDDLALGIVLAGGAGVISVLGQAYPKDFSTMIQLGLKGSAFEAYRLHFKLMDITTMIFKENNPAGIKSVLSCLGLCNDAVRLPLVKVSDTLKSEIKTFVKCYKS